MLFVNCKAKKLNKLFWHSLTVKILTVSLILLRISQFYRLASCASSTNSSPLLVPMLRPCTIKPCWTAVTFESGAVTVLDYPLIAKTTTSTSHD